MQVICLEEPAFYALVEQCVSRLQNNKSEEKPKWIDEDQAMALLNLVRRMIAKNASKNFKDNCLMTIL